MKNALRKATELLVKLDEEGYKKATFELAIKHPTAFMKLFEVCPSNLKGIHTDAMRKRVIEKLCSSINNSSGYRYIAFQFAKHYPTRFVRVFVDDKLEVIVVAGGASMTRGEYDKAVKMVISYLSINNPIRAIKEIRSKYGWGLQQSKVFVDSLREEYYSGGKK